MSATSTHLFRHKARLLLAAVLLVGTQGALAQGSFLDRLTGASDGNTTQGASSAAPSSGIGRMLNFGDNDGPKFLPPEEVFFLDVAGRDGAVEIEWTVVPEHYMYRSRTSVEVPNVEDASLFGPLETSPGKEKNDEYFGLVEVYYGRAEARLPLVKTLAEPRTVSLEITYQGCADAGLCYPPITETHAVTLTGGPAPSTSASDGGLLAAAGPSGGATASGGAAGTGGGTSGSGDFMARTAVADGGYVSEQDRLAALLGGGSLWLTLATFFGLGLLLTFTPCVLPMLPIISSIVVGQGEAVSRGRAFALSSVYVLGMALTYTAVGVAVGLTGAGIQATLQSPAVLIATAVLFVVLAISMFGAFELALPSGFTNRLNALAGRQRGGNYAGAGTMGVLSALIVSPCVAAPLVGALLYIGRTGDAVLGGAALFMLALGMGVPVLLVGTSAGQLLPKAGAWMDRVKAVFGIVLLGMAVLMLDRLLPSWMTVIAAGVLCIVGAIFLGAFDALKPETGSGPRFAKGLGLVSMVYGVLLLVGASTGQGSFVQPLRGLTLASAGGAVEHAGGELEFRDVKGLDGLELALADARERNLPVMLDYYADWCVSCKEMEAFTFTDAGVHAALGETILLRTDVTANDERDRALLEAHGLFGPPAILFFAPGGDELARYRVVGFQSADRFRQTVEAALEDSAASGMRAAL